jgi:flagellar basal-body rod protein FlgB
MSRSVDELGMTLTTERLDLLSRLLDVAALRQDVIAQNVANVNTPNFQTLEVRFEDALRSAIAKSSSAAEAAKSVRPEIVEGAGGVPREDGNNVDADIEMARLQKNALYAKVYSQLMANELAQFRSAIGGR